MLNKEERETWKHLHAIFEHGQDGGFSSADVLRYEYLTRLLDFRDHDRLCRHCFADAL
jgi:hypothetical protein